MKSKLTNHSKQRLNERFGLIHKEQVKSFKNALINGISPANMYECEVKDFLLDKQNRNKGKKIKLYKGIIYIYKNKKLITAYKLPENISDEKRK